MTDYVSSSNRLQHVISEMLQYSGETKRMADSTFVKCPFHGEHTPSFRIFHGPATKIPGAGKCYGCGQYAPWDVIADKLGLKPFKKQRPTDEYINLNLLSEPVAKEKAFVPDDMTLTALPEAKAWRGIKTSLLTALGAKLCVVTHSEFGLLKPKIYLPVLINKKLRGYIKARLKKHADYPSYINAKGSWSKTHGLFPYDYAVALSRRLRIKTVVLVEGPRDALRLLQNGVPAICILGTQSFSQTKCRQLELAGFNRIILLMDGDCAGIQASEMLEQELQQMFDVVTLKLWCMSDSPYHQFKNKKEPSKAAKKAGISLWDPGSMPQSIIDRIKSKYFNKD